MDLDSLVNSALATSGVKSGFNAVQSWQICTLLISAIGAAGLFIFFTYFKKGDKKRDLVEDIKKFTMFNCVDDLAKIVYYYVSIMYAMNALETLTTGGDPWGFFGTIFQLVFIRFVYKTALIIIDFCRSNTKKD